MKEKMSRAGYVQGNMSPHVEDYQKSFNEYSQEQFGKTIQYMERQDSHQRKMAGDVKKQSYKGRYS
jgi:hypothetical protein